MLGWIVTFVILIWSFEMLAAESDPLRQVAWHPETGGMHD